LTRSGARARSGPALGVINARLVLFDSSNRLVLPAPGAALGAAAAQQGVRDVAYRSDTGNYLLLQDVPSAPRAGASTGASPVCVWHKGSLCNQLELYRLLH